MSLEDNDESFPDRFVVGDTLCTLPPGKMNLVCGGYYVMNHSKYAMYYWVQRVPPNALSNPPERERIVVHWVPKSREEEFKPTVV